MSYRFADSYVSYRYADSYMSYRFADSSADTSAVSKPV